MNKLQILTILLSSTFFAAAQTSHPSSQLFGIVDTAELKLTSCDFEKNAGAMVLFDKAKVTYEYGYRITMIRHKRIKILNDNGKSEANIQLQYNTDWREEAISEIEAQTVNLTNGNVEHYYIDKNSIFTQTIDRDTKAKVFTFPNVKSGSVIEFKYKWETESKYNYPDWLFQSSIPVCYSEFQGDFSELKKFTIFKQVYQPMLKDTAAALSNLNIITGTQRTWAMANVKTYQEEPYMDFPDEYHQGLFFAPYYREDTWGKCALDLADDDDFGKQVGRSLTGEKEILAQAATLKTEDEKIAFLFYTVKNAMQWNKLDAWYTNDGTKKAWDKKTGNSAEINLILYHLLKLAKINASVMLVTTREHHRMEIQYPTLSQFHKTVIYCPGQESNYYVLDASNAYHAYNTLPFDLMGLNAFVVDIEHKKWQILKINTGNTKNLVLIDAAISPDGKLQGSFEINSSGYTRENYARRYRELGEKKYIDALQKENNGLNITELKIENLASDTLALSQHFAFSYNLTEPDGQYIYFNPNQFTNLHDNPFLSATRIANIDFRFLNELTIYGKYKLPAGYTVAVLPKSINMLMPDSSIIFKRIAAEESGSPLIRFKISYKKSAFSQSEYPGLYTFFKKMYDLLNEQVVLKKQG